MVRLTLMLIVVLAVLATACVFAADIVTVPTANQLKSGQFDAAFYYIGLDWQKPAPQNVMVQTVYLGLTDKIEVDLHRYDIDKAGQDTIINASYLLMSETMVMPDIVVGIRNATGTDVSGAPKSDKRSYYVAAAKTLKLPAGGPPALPIVRLHAGIGTKDYTLLGEDRHGGLFGGVQSLLTPEIGAVVLHDSQDLITGLTYTPKNTRLTMKGGTFGDHWWVGLSWAK